MEKKKRESVTLDFEVGERVTRLWRFVVILSIITALFVACHFATLYLATLSTMSSAP